MDIDLNEIESKARPGAFSTLDMEVLIPDILRMESGEIYLEVGVDKGKSLSVAKMVAKRGVEIIGVDLKEDPKVKGTLFYQGDSVLISQIYTHGPISVLFIDGDHTYNGCHRDIEAWVPHLKEDGTVLFHDFDESSPGVMWAVAEAVCTGKLKGFFSLHKYHNKNTSMARIGLRYEN